MSHFITKTVFWVPTRSDKNRAVQPQKMASLEILDLGSRGAVLSM